MSNLTPPHQTRQQQNIPFFGLYGESAFETEPEYIHIEDIAARSSEVGWVIEPHRHNNMFQVLCVFGGQFEIQLDEDRRLLAGAWAVTIPPGVVHGFRFEPGIQGAVLTLADPLLSKARYQQSKPFFESLLTSAHAIEFFTENGLLNQLKDYLELIVQEFEQSQKGYKLMLEWMVGMVMVTLERQLEYSQLQATLRPPGSQSLEKFRILLEQNYQAHWSVQQFAKALNTSVSTLNRLCNNSFGMPAKSMIQARLLIEAKRKLIYTQDPVDHIAYVLGFGDPAYFSRFFKKMEGSPPSTYRIRSKNNP